MSLYNSSRVKDPKLLSILKIVRQGEKGNNKERQGTARNNKGRARNCLRIEGKESRLGLSLEVSVMIRVMVRVMVTLP